MSALDPELSSVTEENRFYLNSDNKLIDRTTGEEATFQPAGAPVPLESVDPDPRPPRKKIKNTQVRLNPALYDRAAAVADERMMGLAYLVNHLVEKGLNDLPPLP